MNITQIASLPENGAWDAPYVTPSRDISLMHNKFILLIIGWCSVVTQAFAIDSLTLQFGSLSATGWQADGVVVHWQGFNEKNMSLTLDIASLTLPTLKQPLQKLRLACASVKYTADQITCPQAQLQIEQGWLDQSPLVLSFTYWLNQHHLDFRITKWTFAGGHITAQAKSTAKGWQAELQLKSIDLEKWLTSIATFIELPTVSLGGNINLLKITLAGQDTLQQVQLEGETTGLKYANSAGSQAGENVTAKLTLQARQTSLDNSKGKTPPKAPASIKSKTKSTVAKTEANPVPLAPATDSQKVSEWHITSTLSLTSGDIYSDPIYATVGDHSPVTVAIDLTWQPSQLQIHSYAYTHPQVIRLQGFGDVTLGDKVAVNHLTLELRQSPLKAFYTHYLQAWLGENHEWSGMLDGRWDWDNETHAVVANLYHLSIAAKDQSYGWKDLNGNIHWHSQRTELPSQLRWSGAYVMSKVKLGASQLQANFSGPRLRLLAPWSQPFLDGAIVLEKFDLENLGKEDMKWELRGKLQPISLHSLSTTLGGPTLNGQISGEIPPIVYHNKQLNLKGNLKLQVFEGEVTVPKLTLLFDTVSDLQADIDIDKFNLKTLTKVTEFGDIQGQLSGYVHKLHLINWQPVSFDAYFATPKDNTLPKKISQQAINNLSNLGGSGGVVNALSQSVLRVFENFSYDQIGWGCVFQNGICQMRGAATAATGYYIVKGGGLPRIDVIGYNLKVDWEELLNRLKRISQVKTPVVK